MPQTGPRTKRGKAASSRNAFKHGVTSDVIVIAGQEDTDEWEGIRDGIVESLQPEGALEHMLAERVAICLWRLRRLDRWQAVTIRRSIDDLPNRLALRQLIGAIGDRYARRVGLEVEEPEPEDPEIASLRLAREEHALIIPPKEDLERIMRYESHLHRKYIQTLHELEAMQARRKGGSSPLARLDILGAPAG